MGEAINLVSNFKVGKVIFNCGEFNDLGNEFVKVLGKKKIPYYSCIKKLNIDDNKLYFLNNNDYGNENDNYLGIKYSSCNGDYSCNADYKVSIYNVELTDEEIIYIDEGDIGEKEQYFIIDDKYAEEINYDLRLRNEYQATEYKPLFGGDYFKFKLIKQ